MSNGRRFDWQAAHARIERVRQVIESGAAENAAVRDRIYRERAERLARPAAPLAGPVTTNPVLIFAAGKERYGLPLSSVSEIVAQRGASPIPGAPPLLAGVTQVRGEIFPVVNLAHRLNLPEGEAGGLLIITVGRTPSSAPDSLARPLALQVTAVEDIRDFKDEDRGPAPAGAAHALWITPDLITILNPDWLLKEDVS